MISEQQTEEQDKLKFSDPSKTPIKELIRELQEGMLSLENSVNRLIKEIRTLTDKF